MVHALLLLLLARPAVAFEAGADADDGDYARALPLLKSGAAKGDPHAKYLLAEAYYFGRGVPEDETKAWALLLDAAKGGDADAMDDVGMKYQWGGRDIGKDPAKAASWFAKALRRSLAAAERGDLQAMRRASSIYFSRHYPKLKPSPEDLRAAQGWHKKYMSALAPLAEKGDPAAQLALGQAYRWNGPSHNDTIALRWLRKSAEQGSVPAMYWCGILIAGGTGAPADPVESLRWLRKAANAGSRSAMFALGLRACSGFDGFEKNPAEGMRWYKRAAAAGYLGAYQQLGDSYRQGACGASKDPAEALKWYVPAAQAGYPQARSALSEMYEKGEGLKEDKAEAYKWALLFKKTFAHGTVADEPLARLEAALTPQEKTSGRERADAVELTPLPPLASEAAAAPLAAAAPAQTPRLPESPDDFALIVGIEHYQGLPAADYAENDAQSMRESLVSLGFPERNVVSLVGDAATRSSLQAYLEEWLPKRVNAKSRVVFYFSGHGSPEIASGQAYLVPSDGNPEFLKTTAYKLGDVYSSLAKLPARQILVALDSCFSGAGGRSVIPKGVRPLVNKVETPAPEGGRLVVLAAAEGDQVTGGLDDVKHGAFTFYLLQGLGGSAEDSAGTITAGGLERFLRPKVADAARRRNRDQTPVLLGDPATVLFRLKPTGP